MDAQDAITHGFRLAQRSAARLNRIYLPIIPQFLPGGLKCLSGLVRFALACQLCPQQPSTSTLLTTCPLFDNMPCTPQYHRANTWLLSPENPMGWTAAIGVSGTARPGGSPAGRLVYENHASKRLPSPIRRMVCAWYTTSDAQITLRVKFSTLFPIRPSDS